MKKYIDGALVGTQTNATGSRWDISGGQFSILADENNESSMGFLSSFRFVDSVMSDSAIAILCASTLGEPVLPANKSPLTPPSNTRIVYRRVPWRHSKLQHVLPVDF